MDERSFRNAKLRSAFQIAYKTFADLVGKGALFVITVAAARRLSPAAFAVFSLGSTLGWMLAVGADFGMQLHLAREVARRPERSASLLRSWLRVRLWTAAAVLVAVSIGLGAFSGGAAVAVPMAVLAAAYACSGLVEFLHYSYRGLSRSDLEASLTLWQRGGTLACGLAALAWRPDVTVLAIAMLVPVAVVLIVSLRIAAGVNTGGADRAAAHATTAVFRRDVLPIGVGILLSAPSFRIDLFLVQRWAGAEPVAIYNAVFRLVEALRLFPAAVLAVALPVLCRATRLRPLMRVTIPVTVGAMAAAVMLASVAQWLVPLVYGARFAPAVATFRILLMSFPLLALNLALTPQLVGWNGQRAYAVICALALVVNLGLNARLIPAWSIDGAAWATFGTDLFLTAACAISLAAVRSRMVGAVVRAPVAAS